MPVWLVTGATGFLGRSVISGLAARKLPGVAVVALGRTPPDVQSGIDFVRADLSNPASLRQAIESNSPDTVIHTAGRTPPAPSEELYQLNTLATVHLLDAVRALNRPVRVVLAGSAAELGPVDPSFLPIREDHPCRPVGSYGLSKWLATAAGLAAPEPLEVMVARIFNPIGPGTPENQAFGRFAALLAQSTPDPLSLDVGDLEPRRDFIDVRDVARALIALGELGRPGLVYNVGSGRSWSVREGLNRLIALSGREVRVRIDPALAGRPGPTDSRACIDRIFDQTGWSPEIPWEQSLEDLWLSARAAAGCH